jgi:hypothetical protein
MLKPTNHIQEKEEVNDPDDACQADANEASGGFV